MRTAIIIVAGVVLLGEGQAPAMTVIKLFMPVWLAVALINLWFGVSKAGYSVAEEFPIFLVIFLIPLAIAAFAWWRLS